MTKRRKPRQELLTTSGATKELRKELTALAAKNGRSRSAETVRLLWEILAIKKAASRAISTP